MKVAHYQFYLTNFIALLIFYILVHVVIAAGLDLDHFSSCTIQRYVLQQIFQIPLGGPHKREIVNKSKPVH